MGGGAGVQRQEEQRHCLELGKEAGLDIAMVTKAVVETIRDTGVVSCEGTCGGGARGSGGCVLMQEAGVRAGSVELGQEVELTQVSCQVPSAAVGVATCAVLSPAGPDQGGGHQLAGVRGGSEGRGCQAGQRAHPTVPR